MALLNIPLDQILGFFFVLVRVAAILLVVPYFESRNVPLLVKVGLAVSVSWLLLPQVDIEPPAMISTPVAFAFGLVSEVAIGLIIGLVVQLLFAGIQLAGQMAGFQMGFAIANVVDPASSLQIPILAQFLNLFSMMIFLSLSFHQYFIQALVDSFAMIPVWGAHFETNLFEYMMGIIAKTFVIAVQLGAPVMVALMLTSVALGLVARTVPQMQILIVAMPVKIFLGFIFLMISLPFCMEYLRMAFTTLAHNIQDLMRLMM